MAVAFLNKPYPYFKNRRNDLLSYVLIGAFVGAFLSVFEPFSINDWITPCKTLKLFGFGLISFMVPTALNFLMPWLIPAKTTERNWTVYKEILLLSGVLLCIAAGNLLYGRLLGIMPLDAYAYAMVLCFTVAVGVFPVSMHVILKHNLLLRHNLRQSAMLNGQLAQQAASGAPAPALNGATPVATAPANDRLQLLAENNKDTFSIAAAQLLYIVSADNYSEIVFTEHGALKKHLFRSSLKRIEGQLADPYIIRCHRAYIVSLAAVKRIEGNAAGYKLFFNHDAGVAYVSRNYIASFTAKLKGL